MSAQGIPSKKARESFSCCFCSSAILFFLLFYEAGL
jgi:hypothetical protein